MSEQVVCVMNKIEEPHSSKTSTHTWKKNENEIERSAATQLTENLQQSLAKHTHANKTKLCFFGSRPIVQMLFPVVPLWNCANLVNF
jgi:50S ribosomal subunit-associated GTPase HflX